MIYDGNNLTGKEKFQKDDIIEYEYSEQIQKLDLSNKICMLYLELYGGEGGWGWNQGASPGKGGYTKGYININLKELYIVVGGAGKRDLNARTTIISGGYNGGGNAGPVPARDCANGSGGGCSHIAFKSGLLDSLSDKQDSVIIVAAGGGGAGEFTNGGREYQPGGAGGGLTGSAGARYMNYTGSQGGTQTSGGSGAVYGSFGHGGDANRNRGGAGGGAGWYGGGSGDITTGAAGGSSYMNDLYIYDGETISSQRSGNGFIRITILSIKSLDLLNSNIYKNINNNEVIFDYNYMLGE